jgi:hypothetical protein
VDERPGILRSNVDTVEATRVAERRARPNLLVPILVVAIALVVGAAIALLLTAGRVSPRPAGRALVPTTVPTPASALGQGQRKPLALNAPLPAVNGISCDTLESTIVHQHVHLAVFFDGEEQLIPMGVGIGEPWQVADTEDGPFVEDGSCFYWLHTHTEDGVVHIESPVRRPFTLGDFFAIWEQPLSATQVGPARGAVIVYVNGDRVAIAPQDVRLAQHAQIQLNVGADVPPYVFEFPPGD